MIEDEVRHIAEEYLEYVRPSGSENIMASCPFHETDNPEGYSRTFGMSLTRGIWHCFSCQESGNLHSFLKKVGVGHRALKRKYGMLLDDLRTEQPASKKKVERVQTIPEHMLGMLDFCPVELLEAGFEERTLRRFDVGYDRKRDRITYPIRTINGELVGLVGRRRYTRAKYLPYDDELKEMGVHGVGPPPIGQFLWNADKVLPEVLLSPHRDTVVLVEGYKGCMWVWQAGYTRVTHSFGSGLTDEQADIAQMLGDDIVIMYDGDEAGKFGTIKAGNKLRGHVRRVRVAELMAGHQPDDLSIEDLEEVIDCSSSFEKWKHEIGDTREWRMKRRVKRLQSELSNPFDKGEGT